MNKLIIYIANYLFIVLPLLWILSLVLPRMNKKLLVQGFLSAIFAAPAVLTMVWVASRIMYSSRPFVVNNFTPLIPHVANNGFPSDHTTFCILFASLTFYNNKKLGVVGFALALLVGLSRIMAGVHSFADIVGGVVIGFTAATIGYYLSKLVIGKYSGHSNRQQGLEHSE